MRIATLVFLTQIDAKDSRCQTDRQSNREMVEWKDGTVQPTDSKTQAAKRFDRHEGKSAGSQLLFKPIARKGRLQLSFFT